ncbi:MAG TPA: histidine--tRNA ligase [Candidatus Sumerlaeota bacterium]|nr:histidine--tRNA ligase [Candidatus Sumerlaeota bacterium]
MSSGKIQSIRGMGDVLPIAQQPFIYQSAHWVWLKREFASWCELHGYQYVETPVVEELELFKRTSGETSDIVGKEMYLVKRSSGDGGGEELSLALRPEGSAGVCRAVVEHGLAKNAAGLKFYYIAPMFRSERPQRGRYRQHTQLGAEIFKEASAAADVEMIAMLAGFYKRIGLGDVTVKINSVGDGECRPRYREKLIQFLEQFKDRMSEDSRNRMHVNPMRALDSKDENDRKLFADAPTILDHLNQECIDHFEEVKQGLTKLEINFEVNPRLVRGLDYYTKTAFEFECNTLEGAIKVIGGGGRYDGLVAQLGGPSTPGVGFGTSIERTLLALESQKVAIPAFPTPRVMVAYMDSGVKFDAFKIVEAFRAQDIHTDFLYQAKNLGKQMKHAAELGVEYVVMVGGEEWERGDVRVKNFKTQEQSDIPKDSAVQYVRGRLAGKL